MIDADVVATLVDLDAPAAALAAAASRSTPEERALALALIGRQLDALRDRLAVINVWLDALAVEAEFSE